MAGERIAMKLVAAERLGNAKTRGFALCSSIAVSVPMGPGTRVPDEGGWPCVRKRSARNGIADAERGVNEGLCGRHTALRERPTGDCDSERADQVERTQCVG